MLLVIGNCFIIRLVWMMGLRRGNSDEISAILNAVSNRQIVTFHELLHGVVLALRAYLFGNSHRFIIPSVDKPNGGRPVKAGYLLYGRSAGKTDFWDVARGL